MAYKKKFLNKSGVSSPISGINSNSGAWNGQNGMPTGGYNNTEFGYKNYMSRLPEVYTGHPNRIERYNQYEMMDVDAEINACLDIIAEFSTQRNEHNKTPFSFEFKEDPTPHEVELLTKQLQQWCKLNEFDVRMFKIFRNVIKYGDQVFVRDPENFKLYWVDMVKVIKVIVNESEGKLPEQYVIKDININLQNLSVAQKTNTDFAANPATGLGGTGGGTNTPYTVPAMPYNTTGSRFTLGQSESAVDGKHIVHLSLTEGLDRFWPFGQSVLENIFKVYKQKELLEDAVLIYRVQRAPERRMFKIDVGNMPSHMAMAFVERIKKAKGDGRPIFPLSERILLLSSLKFIDHVCSFDSDNELINCIMSVSPDFMLVGEEYKGKMVIGSEYAKEVIYVPKVGNFSTTDVEARILYQHKDYFKFINELVEYGNK